MFLRRVSLQRQFIHTRNFCNFSSHTHERSLLDNVVRKKKLKDIDFLHQVSSKELSLEPGVSLLLRKYNGKLSMLRNVYPYHEWNPLKLDRLPPGFWNDTVNHRLFLDFHAERLKFKSPLEWNNVRANEVVLMGGDRLLKHYSSWFEALVSIYPEEDWRLSNFNSLPKNNTSHYHRRIIEEFIREHSLEDVRDLYDLPMDSLKSLRLLSSYGSVYNMISNVYPEVNVHVNFDIKNMPNNFWQSEKNHRIYIEWLTSQLDFKSFEEWGRLKRNDFYSFGGKSLLKRYDSIYRMINSLYPEFTWNPFKHKYLPQGYWDIVKNQREYIIEFEKQNNLLSSHDWLRISKSNFTDFGREILQKYGSISNLMKSLFPERKWNLDLDNEKALCELILQLTKEWNLESIEDWGKVNTKMLKYAKLHDVVDSYGSVYSMLSSLFPNHSWSILSKNLPLGFWDDKQNHEKFMNKIKEVNNFTSLNDFYNLTLKELKVLGGSELIKRYGTMYDILSNIYPNHNWNIYNFKKLPSGFWNNLENQRDFLIFLQKKLNLESIEDLGKLSRKQIVENGGISLLNQYPTVHSMFSSIFPEIDWNVFDRVQVPYNYWKDKNNVIQFMNKIAEKYEVQSDEDWQRISWKQIKDEGGSGLVTRFDSMHNLLQYCFPGKTWNEEKLKNPDKRATQRWLYIQVRHLFPDMEIIEEFSEAGSIRKSGSSIQLDIYIPELRLAFEYNGEHHYNEIPSFGSSELYRQRDLEKQKLCIKNDINLIVIPYTWDNSSITLQQYIKDYDFQNKTNFASNIHTKQSIGCG